MSTTLRRDRTIARTMIALGLTILAAGTALTIAATARGDSTPVGPLPAGPAATVTTAPNQLVAVAMPRAATRSGLVWRLARHYNTHVVRQITEADVGANVVVVFKVIGRGNTSVVFALTRGDTSAKAIKAITHNIRSR
jgi:hypothetical protein